jgi:hypothetical protein
MIIALDYDHTYTADPELWNFFIEKAHARGHKVVIATFRYPEEAIYDSVREKVDKVYYTSRQGKMKFIADQGSYIDIWIDDAPHTILKSMEPYVPSSEPLPFITK